MNRTSLTRLPQGKAHLCLPDTVVRHLCV